MSYGQNYITPCESCYAYVLPACPASYDNFTIKGSLGNEVDLFWFVEDKFGKVTMDEATTNGSGDIDIPVSSFPAGYFTQFSGEFTIYFKTAESETSVVDLTFGGNTYECIHLSFAELTSSNYTIE